MTLEGSGAPTEGQIWARCTAGRWQGHASGERASSRGWETNYVSTIVIYPSQAKALEAAGRLAVFLWGPIPLTVRMGVK